MALPKELEEDFRQEINQYEEERRMQYVTSIERIGIEKVTLRHLRQLLQHRFESVPVDLETMLQDFTVEQLEKLFDAALTVESLEEFLERIEIEQNLQRGALRMLRRVLQRRFESVPEDLQTRLTAYSVEQLEELLDVALTVDSLAEFVNSLPA